MSTRHLSCLETGRSNPSREVILRLANVLEVPLRERNTMLVAGGFAPLYRESNLESADLEPVRRAVEYLINQHEPYPAFVMNRYWDVLMVNRSAEQLLALLRQGRRGHTNVMLQVFDPEDLRPCIENWDEVAAYLMHHLYQDISLMPTDGRLKELLEAILEFPGVRNSWGEKALSSSPLPLLTTCFHKSGTSLRFFSIISTLGTTSDITLEELRIESLFPADDETTSFFAQMALNHQAGTGQALPLEPDKHECQETGDIFR